MNILLLSNRQGSPDLKAKLQSLTEMLFELGHSYSESFFSDIESPQFINNFDCCIFEYSLGANLDFELYSNIKPPVILILNQRELSAGFRNEPFSFLNKRAQKKLNYFSTASSFITYSSDDKCYFSSFLVQAMSYPTESRGYLINQFSSSYKDNLLKIKNILEEVSEISSLSGQESKVSPAFAYLYERAENPTNSFAKASSNLTPQTISQKFVVPSENCQKIGIKMATNLDLSLKLFDENSNLISSKEFQSSEQNILWLKSERKFNSLLSNTEIKGGRVLKIEVAPSVKDLSDKNNILFKPFLDKDLSYPYINWVHEGLPLKIYFSFAEFSTARRFVVLALRGIRMIRDGEWRRFVSALLRKTLSLKTKILKN